MKLSTVKLRETPVVSEETGEVTVSFLVSRLYEQLIMAFMPVTLMQFGDVD